MPETRVKVYRLDTDAQRAEFQRDQAEALEHGWLLTGRSFRADGALEATYRHGTPTSDEWAPPVARQDHPVQVYVREPPTVVLLRLAFGIIAAAIVWRLLGSPNHTDIIDYVRDVAAYIETGRWPG